mmetsp:Transcript_28058/g.64230  ORF Transcript_28058/g.64230 Transcript_28058/m.64230 type:complete len:84 (+) Transcript_28058:555-806(+)
MEQWGCMTASGKETALKFTTNVAVVCERKERRSSKIKQKRNTEKPKMEYRLSFVEMDPTVHLPRVKRNMDCCSLMKDMLKLDE